MIRPDREAGYIMIRNIEIKNFRCFNQLKIDGCSRVNIIVGDNGSGKTALLEAVFFALASSPEIGLRLRGQRGLQSHFHGSTKAIERSLWGGFFHRGDWAAPIYIRLSGDGPEGRSLQIYRGSSETVIPFDEEEKTSPRAITFEWTDASGQKHIYTPEVRKQELSLPSSEEDLPDFFMFAAAQTVQAIENAARFSELSKSGTHSEFIELFKREYDWIEDISIEVLGGSAVLHAKVSGLAEKIPLTDVSAGINRVLSILLAIASRSQAVVLVDEIENGLYYGHMEPFISALLDFAKSYECQLFLTTHSAEWLQAYVSAAKKHDAHTSIWRMERHEGGPLVRQFSGDDLALGLDYGEEVR